MLYCKKVGRGAFIHEAITKAATSDWRGENAEDLCFIAVSIFLGL